MLGGNASKAYLELNVYKSGLEAWKSSSNDPRTSPQSEVYLQKKDHSVTTRCTNVQQLQTKMAELQDIYYQHNEHMTLSTLFLNISTTFILTIVTWMP